MAVTIRLQRQGAKKHPFYRVVVADSRRARDGRFLELVGTYNPGKEPVALNLQLPRIDEWLSNGATPSDTVKELIKAARKAGTVGIPAAPAAVAAPAKKK